MATIINNPGTTTSSDNGNTGAIVGIILFILILLALFYYGLPYLRGAGRTATGSSTPTIQNNVQGGAANPPDSGTQINVPDKVDVNVQGQGK